MADSESTPVSVRDLILVPAGITLGVTILRLVGELNGWSPALFNSEAGGGGAIVGITWLVPVFGIYFALKLARSGAAPTSAARVRQGDWPRLSPLFLEWDLWWAKTTRSPFWCRPPPESWE